METKKLTFLIDFSAFPPGASGGFSASGTVDVEMFSGDVFHGITLSHMDERRGGAFNVITRTSVGESGFAPEIFTTPRYEVHNISALDPLFAAEQAIDYHLEELLPGAISSSEQLTNAIKDPKDNDGEFYQMSYRDRVVAPIKTAILAMGRDLELFRSIADDATLWAIGTWTLSVADPNRLNGALAKGIRLQDVLVVPADQRGEIKLMLL